MNYTFLFTYLVLLTTWSCNPEVNVGAQAKPASISAITLSPEISYIGKRTLEVKGVQSGDTVNIYTNNLCAGDAYLSAKATSTSITFTLPVLKPGTYEFFAKSNNGVQNSDCSTVSATLTKNACPPDYAFVKANPKLGTTKDFCFMKYEAYINSAATPYAEVTTADGSKLPSVYVGNYKSDYFDACKNIPKEDGDPNIYTITSNAEWMTIAHEIESLPSNWSSGTVGSGYLSRGWSIASWSDTMASNTIEAPSRDNCLYNTNTDTCGTTGDFKFKRTHYLKSGETIWDFAGNANELVDWEIDSTPPETLNQTPGCSNTSNEVYYMYLLCPAVGFNNVMPIMDAIARNAQIYQTGSIQGFGTPQEYSYRGGNKAGGAASGIYALTIGAGGGFRCIYRYSE